MQPFQTRFAVRAGRGFRGPKAFPRLGWQLTVRRLDALSDAAILRWGRRLMRCSI